jgi:hypothetical protein
MGGVHGYDTRPSRRTALGEAGGLTAEIRAWSQVRIRPFHAGNDGEADRCPSGRRWGVCVDTTPAHRAAGHLHVLPMGCRGWRPQHNRDRHPRELSIPSRPATESLPDASGAIKYRTQGRPQRRALPTSIPPPTDIHRSPTGGGVAATETTPSPSGSPPLGESAGGSPDHAATIQPSRSPCIRRWRRGSGR